MICIALITLLVAASNGASINLLDDFTALGNVAPNGIVNGIVPCGTGHGYVLQVRVSDCTSIPCQLVLGKQYSVEVDFIPSAAHKSLTLIGTYNRYGNVVKFLEQVVGEGVTPGHIQTATLAWTVAGIEADPNQLLRIEIVGDGNDGKPGVVELCGLAGVDVVSTAKAGPSSGAQ